MTPDELLKRVEELERKVALNPFSGEVNNISRLKIPFVYAGKVNADGTASKLPSGWTSAKGATGNYTVTHNLGHTNYAVAFSADITGQFDVAFTVGIEDITATTFGYNTVDVGGVYADQNQAVHFVLVTIPVV